MAGVSRVMIVDRDAGQPLSRVERAIMTFRSDEPSASRREPMGAPTRRSMLKGTVALAGLAAVQAAGLGSAAAAAPAGTSSGHAKVNVLLVHGAWVDGSLWSRVVPILQQHGHNVVALQLPMTSLAEDVAWTRHVLAERLQGPTVLAGQSYGGAVISSAATGVDNVISLVFAAAFAPDEGETLVDLNGKFPPPPSLAHVQPDSLGFLWFDPAAFPDNFAQDLPVRQARVLGAAQKPIAAGISATPAGPPAWRTLPSWYLVSSQDRMINPDLERFMADRIGATTAEVRSSHASPASHPDQVARLILSAAQVGASG
jgi:pimeloyl-ACP methyl ester carboxylesterase